MQDAIAIRGAPGRMPPFMKAFGGRRSPALAIAMMIAITVGAAGVAAAGQNPQIPAPDPALKAAVDNPARSERNRVRDRYRNPLEVLTFFGIKPDSSVVEILPGSVGYYMEILAPYLRDRGRYYAASRDEQALPRYLADHKRLLDRIAADPDTLGKVIVTKFNAGQHAIAPPGSADFVLTFRSIHNWIDREEVDGALAVIHAALKPGGVLGIVGHRGRTDLPQEAQRKSGYVRQDYAIALIEKAGFRFLAASEVNANPRDTKDHPAGVWTLPPTLRLKDQDRDKYLAIGESDRFTLKFVKQ